MHKNNSIIGYTTGVFDLFHIGHLNILKNAKENCNSLIVGVTTDELAYQLKSKKPVIPFNERVEIVRQIKYVDKVIVQEKIDEVSDWERLKFDKIFKGSDWKGSDKWNRLEVEFDKRGVTVQYFDYTQTTSSTLIKDVLKKIVIAK